MINISIKGPNTLNNVISNLEIELPFNKNCIWIGRGEEIHQKQNQYNYAINLSNISQTISRMHACIMFSPVFFKNYSAFPTYFEQFGGIWSSLPSNLLYTILEFVKPCKKIIVKDLNSKTGIYKKIKSIPIESNIQIVLGDSRPIIFHNEQIYETKASMMQRIKQLKDKQYTILNDHIVHNDACSFWILSIKGQSFILINQNDRLTIGRSSDCNIVISQVSISRKHAYLEYVDSSWKIYDGFGNNSSSNGTWKRVKKLELSYKNDNGIVVGENVAKIGDILFTFSIKQDFSYLHLSQLLNDSSHNNEADKYTSILPKELLNEQNDGLRQLDV